jgi:hypothetical protein
MTRDAVERLPLHRNPLRLAVSAAPWTASAYLASYVPVGSVLFVAGVATLAVTGVLALFTFGVPLLVGSALIMRGCAQVERMRSRLAVELGVVTYQQVSETGVLAQLRTRWADLATWRDIAYLVLMYLPLLALDTAGLVIWLTLVGGVTLPLWYWSVPSHGGPFADGLPSELLTAAGCLVLAPVGAYLVVSAARLHRAVATGLLGPYRDPLADAKRVLAMPGPLST